MIKLLIICAVARFCSIKVRVILMLPLLPPRINLVTLLNDFQLQLRGKKKIFCMCHENKRLG